MRRQNNHVRQKVFVSVAVLVLAMSATFILLYNFTPHFRAPLAGSPLQVPVEAPASNAPIATPSVPVAVPKQIKIAKIHVDTSITPVGLNAEGDMDIDEDPKRAAWYKYGPMPGEQGSAVVAGHYGWKNGAPSVFNDLRTLVKGDEISTLSEDGKMTTFVVTRLATYEPDQDATDVFRSNDGKAHLNLVTCQGSWNNTRNTYSERLVVFSDLVVK